MASRLGASTGPRAGARGRQEARVALLVDVDTLQRGRVPEHAEGLLTPRRPVTGDPLQRGRVPEHAEGRSARARAWRRCRSFNGAACRSTRKGRQRLPCRRPLDVASTGPRAGARGRSPIARGHRRLVAASTGPRAGARGRRTLSVSSCRASFSLQRGRVPEHAEGASRSSGCHDEHERFNGAACRSTRKGLRRQLGNDQAVASTGPRAGARGRLASPAP